MQALIFFDESSDVRVHTVEIEVVPREGDFFFLPDVNSRDNYPVERVVFILSRPHSGRSVFEVPSDGPQVKIYLGKPLADDLDDSVNV